MGVGVAIADYDNDGWPDIYVTNFGKNRLYHNNHDGTFTDVAEKAGVALVIGQPEPHGETMTAMAAWTFLSPATFTMTWRPACLRRQGRCLQFLPVSRRKRNVRATRTQRRTGSSLP